MPVETTAPMTARCNRLVAPLTMERCGLPEHHSAHDPFGDVPWDGTMFAAGVHPFDSISVDPDEPATYGPWAADEPDATE